jgi:hypothetical protein
LVLLIEMLKAEVLTVPSEVSFGNLSCVCYTNTLISFNICSQRPHLGQMVGLVSNCVLGGCLLRELALIVHGVDWGLIETAVVLRAD